LGFYTFTPSGAVEMAGIAIRLRNFVAARPKPKLFPHLNEPRTAILTVQKIENGGQDRALRRLNGSRYHTFAAPHVNRITRHAIYSLACCHSDSVHSPNFHSRPPPSSEAG
jgi:hypothetical protein